MTPFSTNDREVRPDLPNRCTVVVPWLEGGGGQTALVAILRQCVGTEPDVVVLFRGSRNFEAVQDLAHSLTFLGRPRTPFGALRAARDLRGLLEHGPRVYSLMWGSHAVIGLLPTRLLRSLTLAMSFHQLPSQDRAGLRGHIEWAFVTRALERASLATAPSARAIDELKRLLPSQGANMVIEPNIVEPPKSAPPPPRDGRLRPVRLLLAGRLSAQKGVDLVEPLLRHVLTPVWLRIAGDGDAAAEARRLESIQDWAHQVEYVGRRPSIWDDIDWCDAVFMPSRWELNPVTIAEAWARLRPVLGSNLPVFGDLAAQGPLEVFSGQAALATTVARLADDSDWRKSLARRAAEAHGRHQTEGSELVTFIGG